MHIVENRNYREFYKQETKIIHNSLPGLTAATPLLSLLPESFTPLFIALYKPTQIKMLKYYS